MLVVVDRLLQLKEPDGSRNLLLRASASPSRGLHSDVWVQRYYSSDSPDTTTRVECQAWRGDAHGRPPPHRGWRCTRTDRHSHDRLPRRARVDAVLEPMLRVTPSPERRDTLSSAATFCVPGKRRRGRVLPRLLRRDPSSRSRGGKAYEILANLSGLVRALTATGERDFPRRRTPRMETSPAASLRLGARAASNVSATRCRPFTSQDRIQENCVTVSCFRLNQRLFELTGGPTSRVATCGALTINCCIASTDGSEWCYYCRWPERSRSRPTLTCCSSSGPHGIALLSTMSVWNRREVSRLHSTHLAATRSSLLLGGAVCFT